MELIKVKDFVIMKAGKTENDLIITEEAILNCLEKDGFTMRPIVYNVEETLKDYTDNEIVASFNEEMCCGHIVGDVKYNFDTKFVTATVRLLETFMYNNSFHNWQIDYDKATGNFNYCACELFYPRFL